MPEVPHHFRPDPLKPPTLGVHSLEYQAYVASYRIYLDALKMLRQEFWEEQERLKISTPGKLKWSVDKFATVVQRKHVGSDPTPQSVFNFHEAVRAVPTKKFVSSFEPAQMTTTELMNSAPQRFVTVKKEVVDHGELRKKAPPAEPAPITDEVRKRRAAARRRQRLARKMRDVERAKKLAGDLAQLGAQNSVLRRQEKKGEWTQVTRKGKLVPKATGGIPSRGPVPTVTIPSTPNRKERRRAIYGPPVA